MRHISVLIIPIVREIGCARAETLAPPVRTSRGRPDRQINFFGDPAGGRTRIAAVKERCPNR